MLQRQMMTFEELFLIFLLVKSPMIPSRAAVRSVAAVSSFSFSFKRSALSSSEQTVTVVLDIVNATSYKRYQNKNIESSSSTYSYLDFPTAWCFRDVSGELDGVDDDNFAGFSSWIRRL